MLHLNSTLFEITAIDEEFKSSNVSHFHQAIRWEWEQIYRGGDPESRHPRLLIDKSHVVGAQHTEGPDHSFSSSAGFFFCT